MINNSSFEDKPLLSGFRNSFPWNEEPNHSNFYYSMIYYMLCKTIKARNIVEIGLENGYTSYMLATAAKENGGIYLGIEGNINYATSIAKELETWKDLRYAIVCANSKILETKNFTDFGINHIDFCLSDGEHSTPAILHELDITYPLLGFSSYWLLHDVDSYSREALVTIVEDQSREFEILTFEANFGLAILRKKEAYWANWQREKLSRENPYPGEWIRNSVKPEGIVIVGSRL